MRKTHKCILRYLVTCDIILSLNVYECVCQCAKRVECFQTIDVSIESFKSHKHRLGHIQHIYVFTLIPLFLQILQTHPYPS